MDASEPDKRESLEVLIATGMWRIASASTTVYFLDLDLQTVVRARGPGSVSFPFDDEWARLVDVICYDLTTGVPESGIIRLGGRPRYRFDPGPHWSNVEWRLQRAVTSIELVDPAATKVRRASFTPAKR